MGGLSLLHVETAGAAQRLGRGKVKLESSQGLFTYVSGIWGWLLAGPQLGLLVGRSTYVPCPCGCLASSQNGGRGPRASIPNGQRVEAACLFRSGSGTYTASPDSRGGDTEPTPWWEEHYRILKLFKNFATNNVSFRILVKTCLWCCLGLIISCGHLTTDSISLF